jgi:1A family penicillin-binding protein
MWRDSFSTKSPVRARLLQRALLLQQKKRNNSQSLLATARRQQRHSYNRQQLKHFVKRLSQTPAWQFLYFARVLHPTTATKAKWQFAYIPQQSHSAFKTNKKIIQKPPAVLPALRLPTSPIGSVLYPFVYTFKTYTLQTLMVFGVSAALIAGLSVLYTDIFEDLPDVTVLSTSIPVSSTKILDRHGAVLFRLFDEENRTIVPLSTVPKHVVFATIAIEDKNFYQHFGFSLSGITRAFISNLNSDSTQGGSTITQQLVKNRLLNRERTLTRKLKELLLSVSVEYHYDKNQILEMYLNQVSYGGATYGIEEAAQKYFGKSVQKLTLAEAALLAGLPQAPSVYSPFGTTPERARARQQEVLRRMAEDGYISTEQATEAAAEDLRFRDNVIDIQAPHFVMFIKSLLAEKYGTELLLQGGLEVRTTLDLELQNTTQKIITEEINSLARLKVSNGAALITNPQTGEILSMIGSKDYFDFEHDGEVNVTTRPRQPGSSIKPLTYALAFEKGFSPGTLVADTPTIYSIPGSPAYSPKNYDGKFHGTVTLREALASSYNIPAVKTLALVSVDSMIDTAQKLGVSTWDDRKRFGLSLTLGGGEILMTEMAQVYGAFANQGVVVPLNPILEISTHTGESLYHNTCALDRENCNGTQVFDPRIAYMITNVLSDNNARTPAFGPLSTLVIPNQEVAVKTGTTNNLRDNWTFGYTTNRVVSVWVGNNDNTPMSYVASGVTGASSIWNTIMRSQLSAQKPHLFDKPVGLATLSLCNTQSTPIQPATSSSNSQLVKTRPQKWTKPELYLQENAQELSCIPSRFSFLPETSLREVSKMIGGNREKTL